MELNNLTNEQKNISNFETTENNADIPQVFFKNYELITIIGRWLGILPYNYKNPNFLTPVTKKEEIANRLGLLLKLSGIDSKETCIISQYHEHSKSKFSFNCHFENAQDDAQISLRWGDMIEFGPEFTIDYKDTNKRYDYFNETQNQPMRFLLRECNIEEPETRNEYWCYSTYYNTDIKLKNDNYRFEIRLIKPNNTDSYEFKLKNEEKLVRYLLSLTFPFSIVEVYKKICELSLEPITAYPNLMFKVYKKSKDKDDITTDLISLKYGQLNKFTITKDDKTISIDGSGEWSYQAKEASAQKNDTVNITLNIQAVNSEQLLDTISPKQEFTKINREIEEVKTLIKSILKR